jgi:predicted MPP superfamily phosphohydrolase
VLAQQKVLWGLSRHADTWLYTSRGIGFWGPPVRVGAPPDVTVLTLTRP